MPLLLLVAFVLVPVAELYVIVQVGQWLGVLPTLALLVVDSLLGAYLLRREGVRAWRAFRAALAERRLPAVEVADGALVILGGALLLTPGFLTDAVGLLCILPPTRAVLRRLLTGLVTARLGLVGTAAGYAASQAAARRRRTTRPYSSRDAREVVDGEVVDGEVVEEGPAGPEPPR